MYNLINKENLLYNKIKYYKIKYYKKLNDKNNRFNNKEHK